MSNAKKYRHKAMHVDFGNGVPIIDLLMHLQKAKAVQNIS